MYPGMVNSPLTSLIAAIDDTQNTIEVTDGSKLPDAPNLATIGGGENAETVLYTGKSGNTLTGVTRGFQGIARAWSAGTQIGRFFTEYDYAAMKMNIEDIFQRFNKTPLSTTADMTLYVNTATGNDNNDGLTSGTALKTITAAIGKIPQIVNHTVTINVADGTYNENIVLNGFFGKGVITLNGNTTTPTNVKILSATILRSNNVGIVGFEATSTTSDGFVINRSSGCSVASCVCQTSSGTNVGFATFFSNCRVDNCTFSNRKCGIMSSLSAVLFSNNNGGTGNTYGLFADTAAVIGKQLTQPSGATAEFVGSGGVIR